MTTKKIIGVGWSGFPDVKIIVAYHGEGITLVQRQALNPVGIIQLFLTISKLQVSPAGTDIFVGDASSVGHPCLDMAQNRNHCGGEFHKSYPPHVPPLKVSVGFVFMAGLVQVL